MWIFEHVMLLVNRSSAAKERASDDAPQEAQGHYSDKRHNPQRRRVLLVAEQVVV